MAINKQVAASASYVNSVTAIATPSTALSTTAAVDAVNVNKSYKPIKKPTGLVAPPQAI